MEDRKKVGVNQGRGVQNLKETSSLKVISDKEYHEIHCRPLTVNGQQSTFAWYALCWKSP